jgi:dTDP-L-rhamnose 4-epimerase
MLFEDGQQRRDFVHVRDVARAFLLAMDKAEADGQVFNIGSGVDRTVEEVARLQAAAMGRPELEPQIAGKARAGDIRHCIPDLTKAREVLGYAAEEDFFEGLAELAEWVDAHEAEDRVIEARKELEMRGLVA